MGDTVLDRGFFARKPYDVAGDLLGCVVSHETPEGVVAVRLTEVEAYGSAEDPPSHAHRGRTARNGVMFGPPGHVYVYFTYGMHFCANLVCRDEGEAGAVLLRAGEVIEGPALASERRPASSARDLARGPARLSQALGLERGHNGLDCCTAGGPLRVFAGDPVEPRLIRTGPRTGVSSGAQTPWRVWLDGEPSVSPYRPHMPRRRTT